ncbi:penicillin-insensitive murein endopeptidase [Crocinitomicaceae bacterium]|nr:penicillin-insensitive murein endopeptidase [Crocinitomicaceae bacterium]
MKFLYTLAILLAFACTEAVKKSNEASAEVIGKKDTTRVEKYYHSHVNDSLQSTSLGSVSNGKLKNATLIPFKGENFEYFDASSYMGGRAFTNNKVAEITINTYQALLDQGIDRRFKVMEFSNKEGGKMFQHRTHQNGLSVDYMMPLQKEGVPYYELDEKGASHYLMDFNTEGLYTEDTTVSIDFNMAARHILELDKQAKKNGMCIQKVIFNTDLKDELYATEYGTKLKTSGIYITKNLSKVINDLHDDHYHVDFVNL